jgi:glyoxylase-like metal-dependent hydrolase (beta-lactamase superfamily II)
MAYVIESGQEIAIIDPLRDLEIYLETQKELSSHIKYIFETHFHADFVSGHLDLAQISKAPIVFGPTACPSYPAIVATDH